MSEFQKQLIKAGAGTGKTESLVRKVHRLFADQEFRKQKGRPPRLIVCTFTRKANQELKERLLKFGLNGRGEEDQGGANWDFFQYVRSSSLYISTIDGILNLFLKRYGHRYGLSPDFQIRQDLVSENLFDSMAEDFIFEKNFSLLKKLPYPYLKELFIFYFKCRLQHGELSFYNKEDFKEFNRERELFLSAEDLMKKPRGSPRSFPEIQKHFRKNHSLLADLLNEEEDIKTFKGIFKEEKFFNADLFIPLFEELGRAGEDFFSEFLRKKQDESELDINDLLLFSCALLKESPQTAQDFCREWDYWLIDEYQDTSWLQEQIIQTITDFQNVFCVGDPGQSIYFFRNADPQVFKRREKEMRGKIEELTKNRRSTASLISFYNDFFKADSQFLRLEPLNADFHRDKPCVNFITYQEENRQSTLQALYHYIEKLKAEGFSNKDIAILSSRNNDVETAADYLRGKGLNTMLYSSKSFAVKRLILDSLFLLKFIINPQDDTNLKALLRTPYFRLSDQELANQSQTHSNQCEKGNQISFWSFIRDKLPEHIVVRSLAFFLELKSKRGVVRSFEQALMDCGLMDLSYYQDATGASESGLWKLIFLLNEGAGSALECFYSLMDGKDEEENSNTEPPSCEGEDAVELMSIHKSKGLEFEHVILLDFSIGQSPPGRPGAGLFIYDEHNNKMAFAVPETWRDSSKIKSFGHALYNYNRRKEDLREKDRLFYVAMTRARQSLTFFIPNGAPQKNSWLAQQKDWFQNICSVEEKALLDIVSRAERKKDIWYFNEGDYQRASYLLRVQSSESICRLLKKPVFEKKAKLALNSKKVDAEDRASYQIKGRQEEFKSSVKENSLSLPAGEEEVRRELENPVKGKKGKDLSSAVIEQPVNFSSGHESAFKSSRHFVTDTLGKESDREESFILPKTQNILLSRNLGRYLHLFLQKLSLQPFEQIQSLLKNSFLSLEEQEKIQKALSYITQLKGPPMESFLKAGYSEWPFKLKKKNIILQGRVDLWAEASGEIHLFDYKSSLSQSSTARQQLIFYSGVLSEMFQIQPPSFRPAQACGQNEGQEPRRSEVSDTPKIQMYQVYPFEEQIHRTLYDESHKNLFQNWLDSAQKNL